MKIERITYLLTNSIFYYFILPLLCGSLTSINKPRIAISVSLYIFVIIFHFIKEESFLNTLFMVLFEKNVDKRLKGFIDYEPDIPKGFHFDWSTQRDSNVKSFVNLITQNFSDSFLQSLVYMSNSPYPEVQNIVNFFEKYNDDNFNMSNNSSNIMNKKNFMESLLEQVLCKFTQSQLNLMEK